MKTFSVFNDNWFYHFKKSKEKQNIIVLNIFLCIKHTKFKIIQKLLFELTQNDEVVAFLFYSLLPMLRLNTY